MSQDCILKERQICTSSDASRCGDSIGQSHCSSSTPKSKSHGYKPCQMNAWTQSRLQEMQSHLTIYIALEKALPRKQGSWNKSAKDAAMVYGKKTGHAECIKRWTRDFISDSNKLPQLNHGGGNKSIINNEDITQDIKIHLHSSGKYAKTEDIVDYCHSLEVLEQLGHIKSISFATAQRWLIKMGY